MVQLPGVNVRIRSMPMARWSALDDELEPKGANALRQDELGFVETSDPDDGGGYLVKGVKGVRVEDLPAIGGGGGGGSLGTTMNAR